MSIKNEAQAILSQHGETSVMSRVGEGTTVSVKAKRMLGSTDNVGNSATQQTFQVMVGTAELEASAWTDKYPKKTDSIVFQSRTRKVLNAEPMKDGDTTVFWLLDVAG